MDASRFIITDRQWVKMEPHCHGLKAHPGSTGGDARLFCQSASNTHPLSAPNIDPLGAELARRCVVSI